MKKILFTVSVSISFLVAWSVITACGAADPAVPSDPQITVRDLGSPYTEQKTETHVQNNCDGSDQGMTISRDLSQEQTISFHGVVGGKVGVEGGIPQTVKAQIEASVSAAVERATGSRDSRSVNVTLKTDPGYIREHTLVWEETVVPGVVDIAFSNEERNLSFRKIIGVELADRTSTDTPCSESTSEDEQTTINNDTGKNDPTIYDNFDDPAFDNRVNTGLWALELNEYCDVVQQEGAMVFKNTLSQNEIIECRLHVKPHPTIIDELGPLEARLKIADDYSGESWAVQGIQIDTDDLSAGWKAFCGLGVGLDDTDNSLTFVISNDNGAEFVERAPANYDRWYTFRLEIDPETIMVKCFADNNLIGLAIPKDAAKLKNSVFERYLDMGRGAKTFVTSYADDVRILN